MRVVYTPRARARLKELRAQLRADFGEETAAQVLNGIFDSVDRLAEFPLLGTSFAARFGFKTDLRYLFTQHNYVVYRVAGETVMILLVCHEREDLIRRVFRNPGGAD